MKCLKIAVIGYGSIGKRHVSNLLKIPGIQIIICTKKNFPVSDHKKIQIVNSISECLKHKPNIALITNISSYHVQTAIKFANEGIDLFIEKPLSNSIKETNELIKIIKKKKLISQMGCQLRFHKCIKKIKQLITDEKIGQILSVKVECGSYLPEWHPDEDYRKSYAALDKLGGGVILTNIHEIDYLYWLFGDVSKVFSVAGKFSNLDLSSDDLCVGILEFKNNIIGELHLDYFQKPDYRSCKIIGSNGVIFWDSFSNTVEIFDNKKNKWFKVLNWFNYERNLMYQEELKHFIKSVKHRHSTINPVETDGIKTLKIALALKNSSKTGKTERV